MATQREKAFLEDLDALLKKHRAKLNITATENLGGSILLF